jgi:U3 small nucleolar RNA-associated protein MPP10
MQVLYAYAARALVQGTSGEDKLDALKALHGGALPLGSTLPQDAHSARKAKNQPLPELCVGPAFDAEQIWVQLDMATDAALKRTRRLMPKTASLAPGSSSDGGRLVKPEHEAAIDAILAGSSSEEEQGSEGVDGMDDDEDLDGGFDGSEDLHDDGDEEEEDEGPSRRRRQEQAGGKRQKLEAGGKYGFSFDDAGGDEDLEALLAGGCPGENGG